MGSHSSPWVRREDPRRPPPSNSHTSTVVHLGKWTCTSFQRSGPQTPPVCSCVHGPDTSDTPPTAPIGPCRKSSPCQPWVVSQAVAPAATLLSGGCSAAADDSGPPQLQTPIKAHQGLLVPPPRPPAPPNTGAEPSTPPMHPDVFSHSFLSSSAPRHRSKVTPPLDGRHLLLRQTSPPPHTENVPQAAAGTPGAPLSTWTGRVRVMRTPRCPPTGSKRPLARHSELDVSTTSYKQEVGTSL